MPITREFVYEEDDETGFVGLTPTWMPDANPVAGVAHDMLEHFLDRRCLASTGEFMALGAVLALRIENGGFPRTYRTDEEHLASLVFSVLQDIERDNLELPSYVTSHRLADEYAWADDAILAAVPEAFRMHVKEMSYHTLHDSRQLAETLPPTLATRKQLEPTIVALLRTGYRRAHRRYDGIDLYTLGRSTFDKLDKFSERLVHCEMLGFGDRVRINVNARRGSFTATVNGYNIDV